MRIELSPGKRDVNGDQAAFLFRQFMIARPGLGFGPLAAVG